MKRYVALLRGINVSGQKKIKMAELRAHLAELGWQDIQTYVQSGNVIFESDAGDRQVLGSQIEKKILEKYGFDVAVLVKSGEELRYILENNPFIKRGQEDTSRLYVTLLANQPTPEALKKLETIDHSPEEFILDGQTIFFFSPNGYGKAKMSNNFFEQKLKVAATTRNWNTINKLVAMAEN
ncbi:DUF1697 domain-containing protein [Fulvivirgaceae bacterium BMA12]|uniref:DUF1697 domain-containing protein n=1 Tax=Agaribacillus aureus TaxID=3051825 RepID=A0ABT8L6V5_9BACT|nr:DUF1697 domain-containing protein [Fulvivirgaceae bacterium BMA12]